MAESSWPIDQNDFIWIKQISHDLLGQQNETMLRQKMAAQIKQNRPELVANTQFMASLEAVFESVCQVYALTPVVRQDLLKALLNGRIIENLAKSFNLS
jgi:hypothetical protein